MAAMPDLQITLHTAELHKGIARLITSDGEHDRRVNVRELRFIVYGEPVAKGRARARIVEPKRGGRFVSNYTPAKTRRYELIIRERACEAWKGALLADCPIWIEARFFRSVPASWSKKKQAAALAGELLPISKPDFDNLVKSVTDGLQGVIYRDDAQIVSASVSKSFSVDARVEIVLQWRPTS